MLIRGGGRGSQRSGGCCHSGFAALWMLLNFSPRRRIFEVICLSLVGSTSYFDISGIAVFAGTSIYTALPRPSLSAFGCVCTGRFKDPSLGCGISWMDLQGPVL